MPKAVYPGTFDPVTNGHLDIIARASRIFEEVKVAVSINPNKNPLFTLEERMEMLRECTWDLPNVTIGSFCGLLVDYARDQRAQVIVRGLRAVTDFEYEFQMALMNRKLNPEVEAMFMMTNSRYSYLSSSMVKEVARLGGCVQGLVPPHVESRLESRFDQSNGAR